MTEDVAEADGIVEPRDAGCRAGIDSTKLPQRFSDDLEPALNCSPAQKVVAVPLPRHVVQELQDRLGGVERVPEKRG